MSSTGTTPEAIEPEDPDEHPTREPSAGAPQPEGPFNTSGPEDGQAGDGMGDETRRKRKTAVSAVAQFILSGFADEVADWLVQSSQQVYEVVLGLL
ncbi:hypothetical protein ACFWIN_20900 [Streptomyces sp. NPDC127049]|uniref:hypothetical protein n=1 Tax=Streptomyces TaxID=1883 RepID=UPI003665A215